MKFVIRLALCAPVLLAATLSAAPIQWKAADGGNDNWYEYVPAISIFSPVSFATARADALARTHLGLSGYLATVTSAAENTFLQTAGFPFLFGFGGSTSVILGAHDVDTPGTYRWLDGPEAGQPLTYTAWGAGQPNTNEDYVVFAAIAVSPPTYYFWATQGPGGFGYLVEYGDGIVDSTATIPEPAALALVGAGLAMLIAARRRG